MSQQPDQSNEFVEWVQTARAAHGEERESDALERAVSSYLSGPKIDEIRRDSTLMAAGDDMFADMLVAERVQRERNVVDIVMSTDIEHDEFLNRYVLNELSDPDIRREFADAVGLDEQAWAEQEKYDAAMKVAKDAEYDEMTHQLDQWVHDYEGELDQFAVDTLSPHNISLLGSGELGLTLYDAMMDNRRAVSTGTQVPFEQVAQAVFTTYLDATPTVNEINTNMDMIYGTDEYREAMKQRITREAEVIIAMSVKSSSYPGSDVPYSPTLDAEVNERITYPVNQAQYATRMASQREAYRESIRSPQAPSVIDLIDERISRIENTMNKKLTPSEESQRANEMMSEMIAQSVGQDPQSRHESLDRVMDAMQTIIDEPVKGATRGWRIDHVMFAHMDLVVGDFGESTPDDELYARSSELALQQLEKDMKVARAYDRVFPQERFDASPYRREDTRELMEQINSANMDTIYQSNPSGVRPELSNHPEYRNLAMNSSLNAAIRHVEESRDGTDVQGKRLQAIGEVMTSTAGEGTMVLRLDTAWKFKKIADRVAHQDGAFLGLSYTSEMLVGLAESQDARGSSVDYTIPDRVIMANCRQASAPAKQHEVERGAEVEAQHDASDDYDF